LIQAIFWDNDGVLVDTEELFFTANRDVMAEQGVELDTDTFAEWSLRRGQSIFDLIEGSSEAEREALRDERNRRYEAHFEIIHAQTNLLQYFEFVLKGGDYDRHKPHPDPYLEAAGRIGVEPEHCLVVEDSERGLRSAVSAGMRCIVIPNPLAHDAALDDAYAIVDAVDEIPGIVASLLRDSS